MVSFQENVPQKLRSVTLCSQARTEERERVVKQLVSSYTLETLRTNWLRQSQISKFVKNELIAELLYHSVTL